MAATPRLRNHDLYRLCHVESCQTKESVEGIPIGKITYDELSYYLAGKTVEEARRSSPKLVHQVHTLEIFSWDKNKWFY